MRSGTIEQVRRLLALGADVNLPGDLGFTALHNAAMRERTEIVDLLLRHGADASATNEWGQTPADVLRLAHESVRREVAEAIGALLTASGR